VRGIGPGLGAAVAEILQTGKLVMHEQLRAEFPPGVRDLLRVSGLGAKKLRLVREKLGVGSLADLERAAREGRLSELPGFGEKSQARILEAIGHLHEFGARHLLPEADASARRVLAHLRGHPAVRRAELAGSLRRRLETIGNLDFVAAVPAADRAAVADHLAALPGADHLLGSDETRVSVMLVGGFQVDLRLVEDGEFAPALLHFTGSVEHHRALRGRAERSGRALDGHGLSADGRPLSAASEEELYRALGLDWVPPELREGLDEVELAAGGRLPRLLELHDLRGTFHVHTTWSDGTATLEQMAAGAAARGWDYLGIADHSKVAAYARGLSPAQVAAQWQEIEARNRGGAPPRLFRGTECDILGDGALDFDDELLLGFDFVVASVHSRFGLSATEMTARLVRAVSHPCVTFLGHSTGRLLLARPGYQVDLDAVLDAAASHGVIVELNASPHRLDLDWRALKGWLRRGCVTSIHPDAHSVGGLGDVAYGVDAARKAGAEARQVFNTWPLEGVAEHFAARRERARGLLGSRG
jgi:DNA polymerase (family 10)